MAAQWPTITAHLVTWLPGLAGWEKVTTFDGPMTTDTPPTDPDTGFTMFATIGYTSDGQSGNYVPDQDPSGFMYQERGAIHSEIVCEWGEADAASIATIRAAIFAPLNALDDAVRADRRIGVLSQQGTAVFSVALAPVLNEAGTAIIARFVLQYLTVT